MDKKINTGNPPELSIETLLAIYDKLLRATAQLTPLLGFIRHPLHGIYVNCFHSTNNLHARLEQDYPDELAAWFQTEKPTVVCLCGSTRFSEAFQQANLRETLDGKIVLTIGCDMRSDADLFAHETEERLAAIKADLDELHLHKIDMADEVLILNVDGYVGESTRREWEYAVNKGKTIRWLVPDKKLG